MQVKSLDRKLMLLTGYLLPCFPVASCTYPVKEALNCYYIQPLQ